jgi:hypothetical protein
MGSQNIFNDLLFGRFPFAHDDLKDAVWRKGQLIFGRDPAEWRMDAYGSWMHYSEYGQQTTYGWEKDHIDPNGPDELWNLQPLNWLNNRRKSNKPSLAPPLDLFRLLMGK